MNTWRVALFALMIVFCQGVVVGVADDMTFGFDEDKDGNGIPDPWTIGKGAPEKSVSLDTSVKKSGKGSIRLEDASESAYVVVRHMVDAKPNTAYRLTAWAKTDETAGPTAVYLSEYHAPGKGRGLLKLHVLIIDQPREWKEFTKEFATTEKTGRITIELCPVGFAIMYTGTAWIDDVKIEEVQ